MTNDTATIPETRALLDGGLSEAVLREFTHCVHLEEGSPVWASHKTLAFHEGVPGEVQVSVHQTPDEARDKATIYLHLTPTQLREMAQAMLRLAGKIDGAR